MLLLFTVESVSPAEYLLDLGRVLHKYSDDPFLARNFMLEEGAERVPSELGAEIALSFLKAPDVVKVRAMVEEWDLPQIAFCVLFNR